MNRFEIKLLSLLHVKIFPFKNIVTPELMFCNMNFIANLFLFWYNYNKCNFENFKENVEEKSMAWNDVEEDQLYTMGRLIAGARNKKNISLEELSQGVMSAADLKHIEDDDEYADKTTWDFLLGRLGISPLIYECYVEQEEYDLFKARREMREISNQIMSNTIMSNQIMSKGIISNENISGARI